MRGAKKIGQDANQKNGEDKFGKKVKKFAQILFPGCSADKLMEASTKNDENLSRREALGAWHRRDVDVFEYYKKIDRIGQGHMGEIFIVTRKPEKWNQSQHFARRRLSTAGIPIDKLNLPSSVEKGVVEEEFLRCFACKTVSTARMNTSDTKELLNEISIMRQLDHPNIIQLFEVYSTKRKMWLITELCYGGDLFSRQLNETSTAVVMEQILQALTYMHSIGVCHRDLKLENVMYETPESNSGIKLIDFGLSQRFHAGINMRKVCGTVYTVAPEIIECDLQTNKSGYSEKSDIFSVGCMAYILLSTDYPFLKNPSEIRVEAKLKKLLNAEYTMSVRWDIRKISGEAREFIAGTLQKDPNKRWSAAEALQFLDATWIPALEERLLSEEGSFPDAQAHAQVLENASVVKKRRNRVKMHSTAFRGMENYAGFGMMKKTVLIAMAKTMDKSMLSELKDLFLTIDSDNTGTISMQDFKDACTTYFEGRDFASDENVEAVFRAIDAHNSGEIHYNEFLAALAESQGLITLERLQDAFDRIDAEGKGYISKGDLRSILGTDANEEVINQMIRETGSEDDRIDYDKFLALMFKDPTQGSMLVDHFTNSFTSNRK